MLLNLPAIAILLATAYMYSTSFNQRLTEDCCHPLWNLIVFLLCGGHLGKLQPTAQLRLWRTKNPSHSKVPDPNASIATLHARRKAIIEVVPDFAILYQRIHPPNSGSGSQPNFLGTFTFDSLPSWTSLVVGQTFVPLLVELKRPVTRHASNIKQFGYGLLRYMILAQGQAIRQARCLFSSALYKGQDTVILIAACGHYWSFLRLRKLALLPSASASGADRMDRVTYEMDRVAYDYEIAGQEEEDLEAEFHLPPNDPFEDEGEVSDQSHSLDDLSMAAVGGEGHSRDADDFPDQPGASEVSTTAVGGDGNSRDISSDFPEQKEASTDTGSDHWVYRWEEAEGNEAEEEKELDEEDDAPKRKPTSGVAASPSNSSVTMDLTELRTMHDALVLEKGKEKVYSTQDLNRWFELYRPLLTGGGVHGLPPLNRRKWHVTDADDLDLDEDDLRNLTWSPILQFGTSASTKALNYIAENLDAFVKLHDGRGSVPSTSQ
jgi:hypothetical protein